MSSYFSAVKVLSFCFQQLSVTARQFYWVYCGAVCKKQMILFSHQYGTDQLTYVGVVVLHFVLYLNDIISDSSIIFRISCEWLGD